jgi:hypothetical protein
MVHVSISQQSPKGANKQVVHPVVAEDDTIAAAHRGEAFVEDTWSHHVWEAPASGWDGQPGRPPARGIEEGMEPDDLLCSRNARPPKTLARANGTSREIDCEAIGG